MTDDDTFADRLRRLAGLRERDESEADEPDEQEEHVAPLERTLVEKQREKMNDVADDLSEE